MDLEFDLGRLREDATEFFVTKGRGKTPVFRAVLIDNSVRQALISAVRTTWEAMRQEEEEEDASLYDPSSAHVTQGILHCRLDGPLAEKARYIHAVANLEELSDPLEELPKISLYAVRLRGGDDRTLTAVKQTSSFGRRLDRRFLARFAQGELRLVQEPEFQLSNDFDFLIDTQHVHIYRSRAFEGACNVHAAILEGAQQNLEQISREIPFVEFGLIQTELSKSIKAAREFAAIRASGYDQGINRRRLIEYLNRFNIGYTENGGRIEIAAEDIYRFIRLLSRKILTIELRDDAPEVFSVSGRKPL